MTDEEIQDAISQVLKRGSASALRMRIKATTKQLRCALLFTIGDGEGFNPPMNGSWE